MKERGLYFSVTDCTSAELAELKEAYYDERFHSGESDILPDYPWDIPDDIIFRHFEGIAFVDEDFFCNI